MITRLLNEVNEKIETLNNLVQDKEYFEKLDERIEKANDYIQKQQQEIERLNKQIEEYQKALDETTSEKIDLENIIKEVREYIENNWINQKDADIHRFDTEELEIEISDIAVLYEILDKETK